MKGVGKLYPPGERRMSTKMAPVTGRSGESKSTTQRGKKNIEVTSIKAEDVKNTEPRDG